MSGLLDDDGDEPDDNDAQDDLLGGADDGLMGDDMGFPDDGDDEADDDELSYRLDEIEKEVDSLGNKVETVRGENEKISDSIESVERNVDRLVDMYEIVTQGINPFVEDQQIGNAFESATEQGAFGGGNDPEDDIDEDIMNSDAEDFLDDDPALEEEDETDEFGDPLEDDADAFDDDALEDEEFDSIDDEFDEAETVADEPGDAAGESEPEPELEPEPEPKPESASDGDGDDFEAALEADADPADERAASFEAQVADDEPAAEPTGENGEFGEPPYLVRHPSRPDAELATIEWLRYLIETAGRDDAARTIAYYESIGWISSGVETYLQSMLDGFGEVPIDGDAIEPRSVLRPDEHKRSLQYIACIATPEKQPALLSDEGGETAEPVVPSETVDADGDTDATDAIGADDHREQGPDGEESDETGSAGDDAVEVTVE